MTEQTIFAISALAVPVIIALFFLGRRLWRVRKDKKAMERTADDSEDWGV